ncbi:hypothetical protein A2W24_05110 [Microgenomates group bacterium RBG_16_45_19]|nr:MAG: hypothetical protein A2W24_05110 [Microgenomates group bacterium RBG_16_45_19]
MLDKARPALKPMIEQLARPFLKVPPNWLSALGPVVALVYLGCMIKGWFGVALIVLVGMVLDSLDGAVARLTGRVSDFGAFWDATLDRVADLIIVAAFGASGLMPWEWVVALMGAGLLVSYTRAKVGEVSGGRVRLAVGLMERGERLLVIGWLTLTAALGWMNLMTWSFYGLTGLTVITVGQRIWAAKLKL